MNVTMQSYRRQVELWKPHSPGGWVLAIIAIALMGHIVLRGAVISVQMLEAPAYQLEYKAEVSAINETETCPVR